MKVKRFYWIWAWKRLMGTLETVPLGLCALNFKLHKYLSSDHMIMLSIRKRYHYPELVRATSSNTEKERYKLIFNSRAFLTSKKIIIVKRQMKLHEIIPMFALKWSSFCRTSVYPTSSRPQNHDSLQRHFGFSQIP